MDLTSIKIVSNGDSGYVVIYYDAATHAKLENGYCIENCCLSAFDVQCHDGEITMLSILLQDGKPVAVNSLEA